MFTSDHVVLMIFATGCLGLALWWKVITWLAPSTYVKLLRKWAFSSCVFCVFTIITYSSMWFYTELSQAVGLMGLREALLSVL